MPSSQQTNDVIRPFDAVMLDVGDGHWLYVEEVGTRGGIPAVFLHGGPGSGSQHMHRSLFDPQRYHAVLFDQRGSGRSHPYLSTVANTTQHLVADIERIREFYRFERWIVVGGSWGSTLAIAYAQAFPERVAGLVLRAIFLGTRDEVEWAFIHGPKIFRPELYAAFVNFLDESERDDPLWSYIQRLKNGDPHVRDRAAHVWNAYERALSELAPSVSQLPASFAPGARLPPTPIIEAHYIAHDFFLKPGELLNGAGWLAGIPGVLVQGRYDLLCPPQTCQALADAWPDCSVRYIEKAGHAMTEPSVIEAMKSGLDELASKFNNKR